MHKFFVHPDISLAETIHKDFYFDQSVLAYLKENVFSSLWQFVGHTDEVPKIGSVKPFDFVDYFIDEPLCIIRNKDQEVKVLSNVCTHRGNLLVYGHGQCHHAITCRYHGRRFDFDGNFLSMPEFKEVQNFPRPCENLTSLPVFNFRNFLFTSLRTHTSFESQFQMMLGRIGFLPMEDFLYRHDRSMTYEIDANWALYCENYLEGFHIPFVHAGLNQALDFGSYETLCDGLCILQIGYASQDTEECFILPKDSPEYGKNVAAYYFFVAPNMMFNFYPWGLSVNIVSPNGIDKCSVKFMTYVWKEELYDSGAGSDLNAVEMEDEEVVHNVQKGVRSVFYQNGRYSVTREQGTHHFHLIMSKFLSEIG